MASLNKVQLIGHLGSDPQNRKTDNDVAITNFSIATNEQWTDKDTGDKTGKTEWHRIVAFGKVAEICVELLKQGSQVYVEGRLQTRSYEKDGHARHITEVVAMNMQKLGKKEPESKTGDTPPAKSSNTRKGKKKK